MIISLVWKSEILSMEAAKSEGLRGKMFSRFLYIMSWLFELKQLHLGNIYIIHLCIHLLVQPKDFLSAFKNAHN